LDLKHCHFTKVGETGKYRNFLKGQIGTERCSEKREKMALGGWAPLATFRKKSV